MLWHPAVHALHSQALVFQPMGRVSPRKKSSPRPSGTCYLHLRPCVKVSCSARLTRKRPWRKVFWIRWARKWLVSETSSQERRECTQDCITC